jgi:hypothetical protein
MTRTEISGDRGRSMSSPHSRRPALDDVREKSAGEPGGSALINVVHRPRAATVHGVTVYVDNAFAVGDWGRWSGGGHLQADTLGDLHKFAEQLGLRREWFQSKPGRPENDHYDLGRLGRQRALELGAVDEDRAAGTRRRQAIRRARRASASSVA